MANYSTIDSRNYFISKDLTSNLKDMGTTNQFFNTGYLSKNVVDNWKKQAHLPSNLMSNMCHSTTLAEYCPGACGATNTCVCNAAYDPYSRYYPVKSVPQPTIEYPKNNICTLYVQPL